MASDCRSPVIAAGRSSADQLADSRAEICRGILVLASTAYSTLKSQQPHLSNKSGPRRQIANPSYGRSCVWKEFWMQMPLKIRRGFSQIGIAHN